ncbi:MAG: TonB-dependent receptor [Reichenbachiella sp.]
MSDTELAYISSEVKSLSYKSILQENSTFRLMNLTSSKEDLNEQRPVLLKTSLGSINSISAWLDAYKKYVLLYNKFMKKVITKKIVALCKYAAIGLSVNCLFLGMLFASNSAAHGIVDDSEEVTADVESDISLELDITGTVLDETEEGIPGVSILEEGTTNGTITDVYGNYTLTAAEDAVLIFSYIGYKPQKVSVSSKSVINVSLEVDATQLETIVVIGYGTRTKGEVPGAVTSVNKNYLAQQPTANVTQALQGSAAGVTVIGDSRPGYDAQVRIRGIGTINNSSPLYVVDGVNGAQAPPTDQIESITVLKDASSTAIYGTRGANGVILIVTKTGKRGSAPQIQFSARTGVNVTPIKYDVITDPVKIGETYWLKNFNDGRRPVTEDYFEYSGGDYSYADGTVDEMPDVVVKDYLYPIGASNGDQGTDLSDYEQWDKPITRTSAEGTNWMEEIIQPAIVSNYSLGVAGGSESTTYSFNGTYVRQQGVMKHTDYNMFSLRANIDSKVKSWLTVGQRMAVTRKENKGDANPASGASSLRQIYEISPLIPLYDEMGNYAGTRKPTIGKGPNPLAILDRDRRDNRLRHNMSGNLYAEIMPVKGLTLKSLFGYNLNFINTDDPTFAAPEDSNGAATNSLRKQQSQFFGWNWTNTLTYSTTFGEKHRVELLLGSEANEAKNDWLLATRDNYAFTDEDFYVINGGDENVATNGGAKDVGYKLHGYFGRLFYGYDNKYIIEGTLRRDGSSRFGPENQYGYFPAASLAWNISEESFMKGISWLNYLKVRGSYGKTGNDQIGNYNYFDTYGQNNVSSYYAIDGSNNNLRLGYDAQQVGNPFAHWETTISTNIAVEATVFNNLDMSLDFWSKDTEGMLYQQRLPGVTGRNLEPAVNLGDMENEGLDLTIDYRGEALGGDLKFSVSSTWSVYRTKIKDLNDGVIEGDDYNRTDFYTLGMEGYAFPVFYGYEADGLFQTQEEADAHPKNQNFNQPGAVRIVDQNGDNEITELDQVVIGNPHPDFTTGLNLTVEYKGFDLAVSFYASVGNEAINWYNRFSKHGLSDGVFHPDYLYKSWGSPYLEDNSQATLPKISNNTNFDSKPTTLMVEDASYLRLQNLQIGYNFPPQMLEKIGVSNMRLYVMGSNLFTLTGYSGLNPEVAGDQPKNRGLDIGAWPVPRTYMVGLNLTL